MSRIRFETAQDVFDAFPAARDDIVAAPTDDPPLVFIRRLMDSHTPEDAVAFCAYVLPRREAVWWACRCVADLCPQRAPAEEAALKAAEAWVNEPEDASRWEALRLGSEGGRSLPATWAALAAGWSGGSLAPPDQPPVPAPQHLTAKAVRTAVLTALARAPLQHRREWMERCLVYAIRLGGETAPVVSV